MVNCILNSIYFIRHYEYETVQISNNVFVQVFDFLKKPVISVCQIEVQKLLKQNEYFERSNNEMEAELSDSIQDADTSDRDARYLSHHSGFWGLLLT